jgi:hypothetical protein
MPISKSISKSRPRTAAQRAASRANSRKSTGPKTLAGRRAASLNALKDGAWAEAATRPMWQTMAELGEDPARYRSLLRDVLNSYPPQSPLELRLCEDITQLILNSERIQQAKEARLVRTYQRLESSREKQLRELERSASYNALQSEVLEVGLRRAPDSPAKFSDSASCLERLQARVKSGDFSDETELNALYGNQPTLRGAGIINAFRALAENPADGDAAASLRLMILEEMRDVAADGQLYYKEHVHISRAMRLECLAPAADREYLQLQRQADAVDRQLERKIKLLLKMQATRPAAGDVRTQLPATAEPPLAWLEAWARPAAKAAARGAAKVSRLAVPSPADAPAAWAAALRHKIDQPRRGLTSKEEHEDMISRIFEVYGLTPEPSYGQVGPAGQGGKAGQPESPAAGPDKACQEPAASPGEDAPLDASGERSR